MRLKWMAVLVMAAGFSSDVAAQNAAWHWLIGVGPSQALGGNYWVPQHSDPSGGSFRFGEPFITGATNGEFNVLSSVSRELPGTSLTARLDWMYNRATSAPHPYPWGPETPWILIPTRPALLDEFHLLGLGFDWDARPAKSWSPYLLTSLGLMHSRIGWNPDSSSAVVTDTRRARGLFVAGGVGFRAPLLGRQWFVEWRRVVRAQGGFGAVAAPLTLGIRL